MGDCYPKIRLAAAQVAPVLLNRKATVEKACKMILEAGQNGADIVGFPESFISGYTYWLEFMKSEDERSMSLYKDLFRNSVAIPSKDTDELCAAAKEANIYVVMGINEKEIGAMGTPYVSQLFISNKGQIMGKHRKIVPTATQRLIYGAGDGSTLDVFMTEFGEIGGLICGENTISLARYTLLALGEKIHVASWPAFATKKRDYLKDAIDVRVRNHAFEGKIFVISVTGIFNEEMKDFLCLGDEERKLFVSDGGHSSIIGPKGQFINRLEKGEGILYANVDFEDIIEGKMLHDVSGHYNRFDIFNLNVNRKKYCTLYLNQMEE